MGNNYWNEGYDCAESGGQLSDCPYEVAWMRLEWTTGFNQFKWNERLVA